MRSFSRRFVLVGCAVAVPVAVLCCGGGDDATTPDDGGAGQQDGTISGDGSTRDSGATDGGTGTDAAGDATACTATPCVVQIAAGGDQTCALINDGTIRCWGQNFNGQIGVGGQSDGGFDASVVVSPVQVPGVSGVTQIVTADWGRNGGLGDTPFTCARIGTASVSCWGSDDEGQLGRGAAATNNSNPTPASVTGITGVTEVAAGPFEICALLSGGTISCWGYNGEGELGPGDAGPDNNPFPASFVLEAGAPSHIVFGRYHACVLLASGLVQCWGENSESELGGVDAGPGGSQPVTVPGVSNIVELSSTGYATCGRTTAGDVVCWGRGNFGQLGRDAGIGDVSDGPGLVDLPAGKKATLIGTATNHACARLDDDSLWCWGRNFGNGFETPPFGAPAGQIGPNPDGGSTSMLQQIAGLSGRVVQIVGGYAHTCVLIEGGSVQCWGSNHAGQLGNGTADELAHPTPATVAF